ncbi:MAG: hypothetical protein IIA49_15250, partial [Bacteroidetes bacterium]|nr:hypothetical protein [Bacteroidota bacterium]
MSKNKLLLSIAMILVVALSLPIAFAQLSTGSQVVFVLINAAVIGIVLFILQAILMPGKDPKEKTSVWIIIIAASLLIAWFLGRTGYIWQTGFIGAFFGTYRWYIVLGNSIIIAAALYFLLGLLKVVDLKSP